MAGFTKRAARPVNAFIKGALLAFTFLVIPRPGYTDDPIKKAKIQIDNPVFDFGTVSEGAVVTHQFTVRNTGTSDLSIQKVIAGCGCTATSASTDSIPSGQTGTINVSFDSSGFSGDKVKEVRVFSNDSESPTTTLTIKGRIESAVVIDPPRVAFGEVPRRSFAGFGKEVTIKVKDGSNSQITDIKSYSKALTVSTIGGDSKSKRVKIGIADSAPTGELRERVLVTVADKSGAVQTMNIPVIATIRGPILVQPSTLSFGVIEGAEPMKKNLKLEISGSDRVGIKGVSSDTDAVTASLQTIKDGKAYVIHVTVDPKKVREDLKATLQIATSSTEQETVSVNVYGVLPPKA